MDEQHRGGGFVASAGEYVARRSRQAVRIVRRTLFPAAAPAGAGILSDEADEDAARAAVAVRLARLAETAARLDAELSLCAASELRPARRADVAAMRLVDTTDVRGVCFGDGAVLSRGCTVESRGDGNFVVLAANVHLTKVTLILRGTGNLIYFGPETRLRNVMVKAVGDDNIVAFGRDVSFESGTVLCEREGRALLVGDDCMFSNSIILRTTDHHGIFDRSTKARLNEPADVVVGAHVWLGNGARVNKGTRIGTGTVVGQMSIVGGTLEANCIYAGVPARKLRSDVVWSRNEGYGGIPKQFR
jgi:acetyltransferase-like isoleucine patch superfamily enzyme